MNILKKLLSLVCPVENDRLTLGKGWIEKNGKLYKNKFTYEKYAIDRLYKLKKKLKSYEIN